MSAQRKRYLQLADRATEPRGKLFYKLMADLAPAVSSMSRAQVNQVGAATIYEVVVQAAASLVAETAFNLGVDASEIDKVVANFKTSLEGAMNRQTVLGPAPCTPKLDS